MPRNGDGGGTNCSFLFCFDFKCKKYTAKNQEYATLQHADFNSTEANVRGLFIWTITVHPHARLQAFVPQLLFVHSHKEIINGLLFKNIPDTYYGHQQREELILYVSISRYFKCIWIRMVGFVTYFYRTLIQLAELIIDLRRCVSLRCRAWWFDIEYCEMITTIDLVNIHHLP